MRKSLHWQSIKRVVLLLAIFGIPYLQSDINAQTLTASYCQCDDTGTYPDSLKFMDDIIISSNPGETWMINGINTGLYDPASAPGPLTLFPGGTLIPEGPAGIYILSGFRNYGQSYSFLASTTDLSLSVDNFALSTDNCSYPPTEISGASNVCDDASNQSYSTGVAASSLASINWTIVPAGAGTIVSGGTSPTIIVDWSSTPQSYTLTATGTTTSGCTFNLEKSGAIEEIVSLACNNHVNVSMDADCTLNFVADMILEDMQYDNESYTVSFTDMNGVNIPAGSLGGAYVNDTVQVSVLQNCGGNSCWGTIIIGDNSAPALDCGPDVTIDCDQLDDNNVIGFPFDINNATLQADGTYLVSSADNCGEGIFSYQDTDVTTNLCNDPDFSAIIDRTWIVEDAQGNQANCTIRIYVNKATTAMITWPPNFDDAFVPNSSLDLCGNWNAIPVGEAYAGHPDPSSTGYPQGIFCLNVMVSYVDVELPGCSNETYKIRRTWTVEDICDATGTVTHLQLISVMDNDNPVMTCPSNFTTAADDLSCYNNILNIPAPTISDCSATTYEISYKINDGTGNWQDNRSTLGVSGNNINFPSTFPDDVTSVWIIYTAVDACGNSNMCATLTTFADQTEPTAVCDLFSVVALNEHGEGFAGPLTFDDFSNDNCQIVDMKVRKLGNTSCDSGGFKDLIRFCCEDVANNPIMVELQVTDEAGNQNTCTVEVTVQDLSTPTISCPADVTVNCTTDISNLNVFGTATANYGTCGVGTIVEDAPIITNHDCNESTIIRKWTVNANGNVVSCTQKIELEYLDQFNGIINFPNDHTFNNTCGSGSLLPQDMPAGKQEPTYNAPACSQVTSSYADIEFQYVNDVCKTIVREWTVIDFCQFDGNGAGIWVQTQNISVNDNINPSITSGCSLGQITGTDAGNCATGVSLSATATDNCTITSELLWSYTLDENNDGSIQRSGNAASFNATVAHGTHEVCWTVEDECGNTDTCCSTFTTVDVKKPSPACLAAVTTIVLSNSGTAQIWAEDFNASSSDDCTDLSDLRYSFSPNVFDTNKSFTCNDVANGVLDTLPMTIYVTDLAGNQEYCETILILQDNGDYCTDILTTSTRIMIAGSVYTENNEIIEDVEMNIDSDHSGYPQNFMTATDGDYAFDDLTMYYNYHVEALKDDDYMNGVSTLDLILIQKHILGLRDLGSPYKIIAADINNSQSVSAIDLIELRKLILGIITELPSNTSWRFVDQKHTFANPAQPFPFTEMVSEIDLDHDMMNTDFVGVKIGDVNESVTLNLTGNVANRDEAVLLFDLKTNDHLASITAVENMNLLGCQFTLRYDASKLSFVNIKENQFGINSSNLAVVDADNGIITFSWNTNEEVTISKDETFLTLEFQSINNAMDESMININSSLTRAEAYVANGNQVDTYKVEMKSNEDLTSQFALYQNTPNPFGNSTKIGFELAKAGPATLTVYDATGKLVYTVSDEYDRGYNEIILDVNNITTSGILYYQLDSYTSTATRKMIVIK